MSRGRPDFLKRKIHSSSRVDDGPFGRRDFLRDGRTVPRRLNDRRDGVRRDTSFFSHYKFSAPDSHPAPSVFRAFADDKRMVTCLHIRGLRSVAHLRSGDAWRVT